MIRVSLNERSTARMSAYIADLAAEEADRQAHQLAIRGAQLMEVEYPRVLVDHGLVAKPLIGKNRRSVEERNLVKLKDAMRGHAEKTATGWEAVLEIRNDLTAADEAKVYAIFSGSVSHPINIKNKKALTGWYFEGSQVFTKAVFHPGTFSRFGTLRLVRDRVYQRVRRGSV